jgi:transcription elongation factor Elf1
LHELEWQFNCWFCKLENLRIRLKIDHKHEISDDEFLLRFYTIHHQNTMLPWSQFKSLLDLEEIKQAFRTIYGTIKQPGGIRKEAALITRTGSNNFKKKFKGNCRTCGKMGHTSALRTAVTRRNAA